MKTPAEFEPLGLWMGWECDGHGRWYKPSCGLFSNSEGEPKTSLTDAEAVSALNRLVERGYATLVRYDGDGIWACSCHRFHQIAPVYHECAPTISAAVEEALLRLIAAEKQTQCCTK